MHTLWLARFHDAEVTGMFHDASLVALTLHCHMHGGEVQRLVFFGVKS